MVVPGAELELNKCKLNECMGSCRMNPSRLQVSRGMAFTGHQARTLRDCLAKESAAPISRFCKPERPFLGVCRQRAV